MFTDVKHKFTDDVRMFTALEHKFLGRGIQKALLSAVSASRVSCFFVNRWRSRTRAKACLVRLRTSTSMLCLDQRTVP